MMVPYIDLDLVIVGQLNDFTCCAPDEVITGRGDVPLAVEP
jgi:hypothetical protein